MKGRDALAYARQLLFEQRLVCAWAGVERLRLTAALERWRAYPDDPQLPRLEAERARWREELEHERLASLDRGRRDARLLERVQARLDAVEGVVAQLRQDNSYLHEELVQARGLQELSGELEALKTERSARAAAGARAVMQEKALRRQLEAEERRLLDGAKQLAALEAMAEEDEAALRLRQAAGERICYAARDEAVHRIRQSGRFDRRLAWRAVRSHARLLTACARHARQLAQFDERMGMLHALRESREGLEWRVTTTKAKLIVLRSAAEAENATGTDVAEGAATMHEAAVFVEDVDVW